MAGSPQQHDANYCGPVTVPPPMRDRPPHRGLRPLLFTNSVWVVERPTEFIYARIVRRGLRSLLQGPYPAQFHRYTYSEKTCKSNRLQMSLQRQDFLLNYLKTLSVGPAGN